MNIDDDLQHDPLGPIVESFLERHRRGEQPTTDEYAASYPDLAHRIRSIFPTLVLVEEIGEELAEDDTWDEQTAKIPLLSQVADYRIIREIGRGGMGVVYQAQQESLGRCVALKVLIAKGAISQDSLKRFRREARAAARLHHSHIVPVFDVGEIDGMYYYAMQLIDGQGVDEVVSEIQRQRGSSLRHEPPTTVKNEETVVPFESRTLPDNCHADFNDSPLQGSSSLQIASALFGEGGEGTESSRRSGAESAETKDFEAKHSPITDKRKRPMATDSQKPRQYYRNVARIGADVADALVHAHSQGVLHRDIKPSNLILDHAAHVWVTDFGLAKALDTDESAGAGGLTGTGDVVGTIRYMAPERFRGWSDPRSDVYGLGITLYELLTLRPAFDSQDRLALMEQVRQQRPTDPRTIDRRIPRDLETIILKAIDKEPTQRYQSAADLATDLTCFLNDRPISARRASLIEMAQQWARRNRGLAAMAGVLLTVIVGAWAATLSLWRRAESARGEAQAHLAISQAVNQFLEQDLLDQADPALQDAGTVRNQNVTVGELIDRAARNIEMRFRGQERTEAAIRLTVGRTYIALENYAEAEKQLQRSFDIRKRLLGPRHLETIETLNMLGILYFKTSRVDEAEAAWSEVLQARQAQLPVDDEYVLQSIGNMALIHEMRDEFREAEELYLQAVQRMTAVLGEEKDGTLVYMGNLAHLYLNSNRVAEAKPLLERVFEIRRRKFGDDHPETLRTIDRLAKAYRQEGAFDQAEALLQDALVNSTARLGEEHPETVERKSELALMYRDAGKYEAALPLSKSVLESAVSRWGPKHHSTLGAMNNLAALQRDLGNLTESISLFEQVSIGWGEMWGPHHSLTLISLNNLAMAYSSAGRYDDAERVLLQALEGYRSSLGAEHTMTLMCQSNLAGHYSDRGRFDEAETLIREALEIRTRILGPDHPDTLYSLNRLGLVHHGRGEFEQAESILERAWKGRKMVLGPLHPETLRSKNNLAIVYRETDRLDESAKLFQQILGTRRDTLGTDHPDTLVTLYELALLLEKQGDIATAERHLREAIDGATKRLGADHPRTKQYVSALDRIRQSHDDPPADGQP